jgi:hypothetical protein
LTQVPGTNDIAKLSSDGCNPLPVLQDEEEAMVGRLYSPRAKAAKPAPIKAVKLSFAGADKGCAEAWVPVKAATNEERTAAMCELYQRCIETRAKTEAELAAKYLQPLGRKKA